MSLSQYERVFNIMARMLNDIALQNIVSCRMQGVIHGGVNSGYPFVMECFNMFVFLSLSRSLPPSLLIITFLPPSLTLTLVQQDVDGDEHGILQAALQLDHARIAVQ